VSVTASSFKAEYVAFANTADAIVTAKITDAELLYSEDVWDTLRDLAVKLHVADELSREPGARDMQIAPEGDTVYSARLKELCRAVGSANADRVV
jgi:hypothetical protein